MLLLNFLLSMAVGGLVAGLFICFINLLSMVKNDSLPTLLRFYDFLRDTSFKKSVKHVTFSFHFLDENGKTIAREFTFSVKANILVSAENVVLFYAPWVCIDIV